jgi:hypothetical protein
MERQKPTTSLKHNDEFSKALIESYGRWMGGQGFGWHLQQEETYPELQKKGGEDDFSKKDPKANAGSPDPAVDLKTGKGIKQSHGATIQYTNVVAKEEKEGKWEGGEDDKEEDKKLAKKHKMSMKDWEKSAADKKHDKEGRAEEKKEKMKEAFNLYVEGVHYVFEKKNAEGKEQGSDGKACWKGYKYAGTEGGKDKCVKAGYEPIGELMLDEKAPPGAKYERMVKHIKKGYSKDGELTKKEKGIAYATAWKEKNKSVKEALDPVGKEDADVDNDGKSNTKSDKYLAARRKKVSKIIGANKKMKESLEIAREIEEEKK